MFKRADLRNCLCLGVVVLATSGCAAEGRVYGPPSERDQYQHVDIPKGHMPPPGECRIWYPDVPPGQQPPPGKCHELERRVPAGAILVRG
jgi:hypothetical protein